jgi:hypothetical protein
MFVDVPQQTADALAAKHLPWVTRAEIKSSLVALNWHPENADELAPVIVEKYHGAFRKGMEVALRSVQIVDGKLVVKMPDDSVVQLPIAGH